MTGVELEAELGAGNAAGRLQLVAGVVVLNRGVMTFRGCQANYAGSGRIAGVGGLFILLPLMLG